MLSCQALKCGEDSGHHNETVGHLPCEDVGIFLHVVERYANSFVEEWRLPVGWYSVV